jgi:iron complex outermembrane receptor protein
MQSGPSSWIAGAALTLVPFTADAQSSDGALQPVVITGAAVDQKRWTAPASIDIVDGVELARDF